MKDETKEILEEVQDTEQDSADAFAAASKELAEEYGNDFEGQQDKDTSFDDTDSPEDNLDTEQEDVEDQHDLEESEDLDGEEDNASSQEDDDDVDWKSMYERTATHNQQLQGRLGEVEAQFKSWKGRVDADTTKKTTETPSKETDISDATDTQLQEFVEMYPELAAPVQKLIDARVTERMQATEKRFDEYIEKNVKPIQKRVQESEAQAHVAAIRNAHPDINKYIVDGSFEKWVEKLPPYQRAGAQYVAARGTADEVIQLFDDFKSTKNIKKATEVEQKNPQKEKKASDIVAKARDAMYVKSEGSDLPTNKKNETDPAKMFDQFSKQIMMEG